MGKRGRKYREAAKNVDATKYYELNEGIDVVKKSAYAKFDENIKGSLTPGKLADMVVLDGNPLEVGVDEIKDIAVEMTMIGGKVLK